jgi:hypothetical protein
MAVTRCPKAYKVGAQDDTLRCRIMGYPNDCCAHTKFCRRTMHWENSEYWAQCPLLKKLTAEGKKND